MILRRSRFAHVVSLGSGRALILHGVTQLRLAIDAERRARTRLNHSAAHLAHAALRWLADATPTLHRRLLAALLRNIKRS